MKLWKYTVTVLIASMSVNADASLIARDLDGNTNTIEAYYDDATDLTWLADANSAMTSGFDADGLMTWRESIHWVYLEVNGNDRYGGSIEWRLPFTPKSDYTDCRDWATLDSCYQGDMAQLFYKNLDGDGPNSYEPFTNVQLDYYWSMNSYRERLSPPQPGTQPPPIYDVTTFGMGNGVLRNFLETEEYYAWAVHDGDIGNSISAVPVPTAVWLFGSGLVGLIGVARHKKAK